MTTESDQIAAIYAEYPRKVGKIAAIKAIKNAVTFLVQSDKITPIEARRNLYKATANYARSPAGRQQDKSKVPHPATWFNRGSYLDDPQEWQHVNGGFNGGNVSTGKADSNMGVLAKVLNRGEYRGRADEDGELQASQSRRDDARVLPHRA